MSEKQVIDAKIEAASGRRKVQAGWRSMWLGLWFGVCLWLVTLVVYKLEPISTASVFWAVRVVREHAAGFLRTLHCDSAGDPASGPMTTSALVSDTNDTTAIAALISQCRPTRHDANDRILLQVS